MRKAIAKWGWAVCLLLVCCMAGVALAACGGGKETVTLKAPGEDEPKKLTISLNCEGDVQAAYELMIEEFSAVYGVQVEPTFKSDTDIYWQSIDSAISAKNAPDVFYSDPGRVRQFANKNGALPLDDYLKYEQDILNGTIEAAGNVPHFDYTTIIDESVRTYRYDRETATVGTGSVYALPKDASGYPLGYNENVINRAVALGKWPEGLAKPWNYIAGDGTLYENKAAAAASGKTCSQVVYTWAEFVKACQACQFTDPDTNVKYYGTGLLDEYAMHSWIWTAGGDYLSEDGTRITITDDAFVKGLQEFVDLHLKYDACQPYEDSLSSSHYDKWKAGKVAFFSVGNWDVGAYDSIGEKTLKFDVMPTPKMDADSEWYTYRGTLGFTVNKRTASPTLATRLVLWLSAGGEYTDENIVYGKDSDLENGIAHGAYYWLTQVKKIQLPNVRADLDRYLADDTLRPANKQVYADIVLGDHGKTYPSARTYNEEWWTIFYGSIGKIWAGEKSQPEMTVREYVDYIAPSCQSALDKAIKAEKRDARS